MLDIDKAIVSVAKLIAGGSQISLGAASVLCVPRKPTALEIELVFSRQLMGFWGKKVMIYDVGARATGLQRARVFSRRVHRPRGAAGRRSTTS